MASYSSNAKKIKAALIVMLQAITYDTGSGAEQAFQAVVGSASETYTGSPIARVLPGSQSGERDTVTTVKRIVAFDVVTELKLEADNDEATYDYMYDLTELILDTIDQGDFSRRLSQIDGTIQGTIMSAIRGDFYPAETNNGVVLRCLIDVQVQYLKFIG